MYLQVYVKHVLWLVSYHCRTILRLNISSSPNNLVLFPALYCSEVVLYIYIFMSYTWYSKHKYIGEKKRKRKTYVHELYASADRY